jgi:hypothetical protein
MNAEQRNECVYSLLLRNTKFIYHEEGFVDTRTA